MSLWPWSAVDAWLGDSRNGLAALVPLEPRVVGRQRGIGIAVRIVVEEVRRR